MGISYFVSFGTTCSTIFSHWFYEDFIREENPKFPSLPLKKFSAMLFHACPLLHQWSHDHEQAFNTFMQYKTRVPVCGAIMLNDTWERVCRTSTALNDVRSNSGRNSASWGKVGNHRLGGAFRREKSTSMRLRMTVQYGRCVSLVPYPYQLFICLFCRYWERRDTIWRVM